MKKKGLYRDLTSHMKRVKRDAYTYEEIESEAKKYSSMPEFQKGSPLHYNAAKYRGILDNFKNFLRPGLTRYTDEELQKIAARYNSLKDFRINEPAAYATAYRRNIIQDIKARHKNPNIIQDIKARHKNPISYEEIKKNSIIRKIWTKEEVAKLAKQYNTNKEFRENEPNAWTAAHRKGWMDEIGAHFEKMGNKFKRLVYVYEFPDNHAYVGLTFSEKNRQKEHQDLQNAKSAVAKHILQTNLQPTYKSLSEYIDTQEASNLEKCIIDSYKNNGWIMLNKIKGGGLGGCHRTDLTMEIIKELTQGFKSRNEFKKQYPSEYAIARKYGWLEDVFSEIPVLDRTIWTYDKAKEESKKYNSRFEFSKGNNTAYQNARKNGWLDEFFPKQYGVNLPEIKQP